MAPSIFFVLFWRIGVHLLYPFNYMNCSLQDALGEGYLLWDWSDRMQSEILVTQLLRQSIENFLLFILIMEIMRSLHEGHELPFLI